MTEPRRVVVVDDEPPARLLLASYLSAQADFRVTGLCASVDEAVRHLAEERAEAVFLDIQLTDGTGFEVLERVPADRLPAVVFVTAYDEHAVRAFEIGAIDYLLKPVTAERFTVAIERLRVRLGPQGDPGRDRLAVQAAAQAAREWLAAAGAPLARRGAAYLGARTRDGVQLIPVASIRYLEVEGHYVTIHAEPGPHLVRGRLSELESQLDPERFVRIHRSTIVNLDHVRTLTPWFRGDYLVRLLDGTELRMSRTYRSNLAGRLVADW
jgi:two-component system LytT family response regulator